MVKLSKVQQKLLDDAKARIEFARTHNFYDWMRKNISRVDDSTTDEQIEMMIEREVELGYENWYTEAYEETKNGVTYMSCNSRSLHKLEELGLIEILRDSTGETYGLDSVKVLNY